jgi:mevalonate kinase
MPAVLGRRQRLVAAALLSATMLTAFPALAATFTVTLDQAQIMRLPDKVATIVIGNPSIADATLQSGGVLVVTGKGYGSTNLLAMDRTGKIVMDTTIQVVGPAGGDLIVVYKGVTRESYSCSPECAPRATLGDDNKFFTETLGQTGVRASQAGQAPK